MAAIAIFMMGLFIGVGAVFYFAFYLAILPFVMFQKRRRNIKSLGNQY